MGDAADLLLEGILDEQTGDLSLKTSRLFHQDRHYISAKKEPCPICGKLIVAGGPPLQKHIQAKHQESSNV